MEKNIIYLDKHGSSCRTLLEIQNIVIAKCMSCHRFSAWKRYDLRDFRLSTDVPVQHQSGKPLLPGRGFRRVRSAYRGVTVSSSDPRRPWSDRGQPDDGGTPQHLWPVAYQVWGVRAPFRLLWSGGWTRDCWVLWGQFSAETGYGNFENERGRRPGEFICGLVNNYEYARPDPARPYNVFAKFSVNRPPDWKHLLLAVPFLCHVWGQWRTMRVITASEHLHVRTRTLLFNISGTTGSIVPKFGVWPLGQGPTSYAF